MSLAHASERQRRKDARPQELLDAALDLFTRQGLAATRMDDVAARVGVSKGTLYLYFQSKEALFKAVVRDSLAQMVAQGTRDAVATHASATDRLRGMTQWWTAVLNHPCGGVFKLMLTELPQFPDLARFYEEEIMAPGLLALRAEVTRGVSRGEFRPCNAELVVQSLVSPLVMACVNRHTLAARHLDVEWVPHDEAFIAHHIELVLSALKSEAPPATPPTA